MAGPEQQSDSTGNGLPGHQIIQSDASGLLAAGFAGDKSFADAFAFLGHDSH
jgi:hypothetical protein